MNKIVVDDKERYFNRYRHRLYNLLVHCKDKIPYYSNEMNFELPDIDKFTYEFYKSVIPVLEKNIVRENSELFLDRTLNHEELAVDSTSGTEGKPIICYRSRFEQSVCAQSLWKLRRKFVPDLKTTDKFARFYAFRNIKNEVVSNKVLFKNNDILLPLFDLSEDRLIYYWNEIVKFKPRWLHGPSSTIYNLALTAKQNNLTQYHFELVELTGEFVKEEHYKTIKEVFGGYVVNQYGCREYWPMAFSDFEGNLEAQTDNIFFEEIYNEKYNTNELLITTLKNDAWPLVRYRIGDFGSLKFIGEKVTVNLKRGRTADFFSMAGGNYFNAIVFSGVSRAICEIYGYNVILQYQFVKEAQDLLVGYVKLNLQCNKKEVMLRFSKELNRIIGDAIRMKLVESDYICPDSKTGKTRDFKNNCDSGGDKNRT